jgi:hypothetical protein
LISAADALRPTSRRLLSPLENNIRRLQVFIHRRITGRPSPGKSSLPFLVRLLRDFPALRQLPARFIGIGPRPEHVQSPMAN